MYSLNLRPEHITKAVLKNDMPLFPCPPNEGGRELQIERIISTRKNLTS